MFKPEVIVMDIKGHKVLIDQDDYDRLKHWTWHVIPQTKAAIKFRVRGYTFECRNSRKYLHRVILGITDPKIDVDHKDGNPLNNSKSNLRVLSKEKNQQNRTHNRTNLCGRKGVSKRHNKWCAKITIDNNFIHLGMFNTLEEAGEAYDRTAEEWYGPGIRQAI